MADQQRKKQTAKQAPSSPLKLYKSVSPDGDITINAFLENPPDPPPTEMVFYFQGTGRNEPIKNGTATMTYQAVPPGTHEVVVQVPGHRNLTASITVTIDEKKSGTKLIPDKMLVKGTGTNGVHTIYISVTTQKKEPVPGIHIVIKDADGKQRGEGITNDRGTIDPHPQITVTEHGYHKYYVIAEGSALEVEDLNLEGPSRYPKPPDPPSDIPDTDAQDIGKSLWRAFWKGIRAGRHARNS